MKSDARVRYTRMVIKNAFITLLKQKPLNKISVKDVCELAEINRATFYKHYSDCFDLMEKIEDALMAELKAVLQNAAPQDTRQMFTEIFARIQENGEIYVTLTSTHGDSTFPARIIALCYEEAKFVTAKQFPGIPSTERELLYYFCANGCSGILSHWISTGMTEDTKKLACFMSELLEKLRS